MALRLAGEEYSVVQGLDSPGWLREIQANDTLPGLDIAQNGAGPGLRIKGRITTPSGRLMLGNPGASGHSLGLDDVHLGGALEVDGVLYPDGNIVFPTGTSQIRKDVHDSELIVNGGTDDLLSAYWTLYGKDKAGTPGYAELRVPNAAKTGRLVVLQVSGATDTPVATWLAALSHVNMKLGGAMDANGQNIGSPVLDKAQVGTAAKATPAEGDLKWDGAAHKLQVYSGAPWETVTSA